jgi:hypothetical protein
MGDFRPTGDHLQVSTITGTVLFCFFGQQIERGESKMSVIRFLAD